MKKDTIIIIIRWTKRLLALIAILVWIGVIVTISKEPIPFSEQAPYCMGSTMIIFMLLSGLYRALGYWEKRELTE